MTIDYSLLVFDIVVLRFPDKEIALSIFIYRRESNYLGKSIVNTFFDKKNFYKNFIIGV
jgi:hypothetical protein